MTNPKTAFSLLLTWLALLANDSNALGDKKKCITMSRGKELREKLSEGKQVLLVLGNDDDHKTYKELCSRLESTPVDRVKDLEIAFVKDSNMRRNVMQKAQPKKLGWLALVEKKVVDLVTRAPPVNLEISYPEYVLYKTADPEAGIRFLRGAVEEDEEGKNVADAVSDFLSEELQTKKIGSFVYALGSYDMVAAQVMKYETGSWQQRFWAEGVTQVLKTMFLKYPMAKFFGTVTPVMGFEMELIDNYMKIARKVVEKGKLYPENQVKRLEDMLENDKSSIGEIKKESLSQRVYTLKRFTEPETFSDKDIISFLFKIGMNLLTLLLMLVMIPMMFLSSPEDEEEQKENEEKKEEKQAVAGAEMEDPDKEEENDDGEGADQTPLLTKQEQSAIAIQRAKDSMKEDKENVERVKQK